ncbi:hypothetical protein ACHAWT_003070 [Skeletonema menzelii]
MLWAAPLMLFALNKAPNYLTGKIANDEQVIFFPTAANQINETHWNVPIHGWIFEPEIDSVKRKALIKALGKMFQLKDDSEKRILRQRLMPFDVDNQSLQYVRISVEESGQIIRRLPRSAKDGHFFGNLTLPIAMDDLEESILHYKAIDSSRYFPGRVHFITPSGVSIISDIDDTVKITNYLDKKEFYKNTFIRDFQAVPGMKDVFLKCKAQYDNCAFHFVSASPFQLFEDLSRFFETEGFPLATYHLKRIRVKDKTLLQLFADPFEYKIGQIERILHKYPQRKFILIGDSGEKDPEVYIELCRRYPEQIEKIWIRNVNNADASRMDGVDGAKWRYFSTGSDLMEEIKR